MRFATLVSVALCAAFLVGCKSGDSTSSAPSTTDASTASGVQKAPPVVAESKNDSKSDTQSGSQADSKASGQLAGKWTSGSLDAPGGQTDLTFDSGGTFTMLSTSKGSAPTAGPADAGPGKSVVKTTIKGTFKMDGDKLTMHLLSLNVASDDPKLKAQIDQANASAAKNVSTVPDMSSTVAFKDKDNATLTMNPPAGATGKPQTLAIKRKA